MLQVSPESVPGHPCRMQIRSYWWEWRHEDQELPDCCFLLVRTTRAVRMTDVRNVVTVQISNVQQMVVQPQGYSGRRCSVGVRNVAESEKSSRSLQNKNWVGCPLINSLLWHCLNAYTGKRRAKVNCLKWTHFCCKLMSRISIIIRVCFLPSLLYKLEFIRMACSVQ